MIFFFATYGTNKFGELELLDTNWYDSMPMGNKELKEENERLKKYIDYLKEKDETLKKNYRGSKEKIKKTKEKQRLSINFIGFFLVSFLITRTFTIFMGLVNSAM